MTEQHDHQAPHWLNRYALGFYQWKHVYQNGIRTHYRPLGIVEGFFDTDGTDYEGRADLTCHLILESRISMTKDVLRRRIHLAWSVLRTRHVLLSSRALSRADLFPDAERATYDRYFVVDEFGDHRKALQAASDTLVFVEDYYPDVDVVDFYQHVMNTSRAIDSDKALAKLFVLPLKPTSKDRYRFETILVAAHQITDGLTIYRWHSHLVNLLNTATPQLQQQLESLCSNSIFSYLPAAQEDLYPPILGNIARQRWRWAISRILRHTRHPPPPSLPNPLRRPKPLTHATQFPSKYESILSYTSVPPLNSCALHATLSPAASMNLRTLCRAANASIGSGCFALVALVMMDLQDRYHPVSQQSSSPLPVVLSFPVNPRPFLTGGPSTTGAEESLMLAFSDGLTLPFLPASTSLPVSARFTLLARQAHKQLRTYQKNVKGHSTAQDVMLGSRSPSQLIPALYIGSVERAENKVSPERRMGLNPQGAYPAKSGQGIATCGVSSVGLRTNLISSGMYDLNVPFAKITDAAAADGEEAEGAEGVFIADFRDFRTAVRVREGEFLVGSAGDQDRLHFSVSYDGNAIDPEKVQKWKQLMEKVLEPKGGPELGAGEVGGVDVNVTTSGRDAKL